MCWIDEPASVDPVVNRQAIGVVEGAAHLGFPCRVPLALYATVDVEHQLLAALRRQLDGPVCERDVERQGGVLPGDAGTRNGR